MLSVRWRKVWRDVWGNKSRTGLVVLSIAVGVFGVGAIASARIVLSRELGKAYSAIQPANIELGVEPFDDNLVEAVRRTPGVGAAEGRAALMVRVVDSNGGYMLQLKAVPDYRDMRVSQVWPVSGAWPPPPHEMLLERLTLDYIGVRLGDTLVVEAPDGRQRLMRIAGTVYDLNARPPRLGGPISGCITLDTLEWLGGERKFTELDIRVTGDPRDTQAVRRVAAQAAAKVERSGLRVYSTFIRQPDTHPFDAFLKNVSLLLGILSLVALVLSGFLVINTISAVLAQQVRQIGVMKAIGARPRHVVGIYMGMVLVFALLSIALAVPLGALVAWAFTRMMAAFFNVDTIEFSLPPVVLAVQLGVGLAVPLLAALYPVLSGTRVTVCQAISNFGLGQGRFGTGFIDRLSVSPRLRGLPRPLLLALRNTFRRKGRLALTLLTLTVASTAFVGIFGARTSLMATFERALSLWQYDVAVNFSRPYRMAVIQREALAVPGVVAAESWSQASAKRVHADGGLGREMPVIAPPAQTGMLKPILVQGRWLLPEDENALVVNTDVLLDEPDIQVGDEVRLKIDERESTWRVVGVTLAAITGPILYANQPYLAALIHDVGRSSAAQVVTDQHDAAFEAQAAKALEAHYESRGMRVVSLGTAADMRAKLINVLNVFTAILMAASVLLAVVGALGLAGTMSISVLERTREIGVMRAVGASDRAIRQIVMVEGILIGVMSWLAGTFLAWPLGMLLTDLTATYLVRRPIHYAFSFDGALLWLVVVVILAALASFLPARFASRLTVREVLAYE
jgi:putative ABC transport system permease protein